MCCGTTFVKVPGALASKLLPKCHLAACSAKRIRNKSDLMHRQFFGLGSHQPEYQIGQWRLEIRLQISMLCEFKRLRLPWTTSLFLKNIHHGGRRFQPLNQKSCHRPSGLGFLMLVLAVLGSASSSIWLSLSAYDRIIHCAFIWEWNNDKCEMRNG